MPQDQHPNIIVALAIPALLVVGEQLLLPIFTSADLATAFGGFPSRDDLELAEILPTKHVVGEPAFTFALPGLKDAPFVNPMAGDLILAIDPSQLDVEKMSVTVKSSQRVPIAKLLAADTEPLSIPQGAVGVEKLFMWRQRRKDA